MLWLCLNLKLVFLLIFFTILKFVCFCRFNFVNRIFFDELRANFIKKIENQMQEDQKWDQFTNEVRQFLDTNEITNKVHEMISGDKQRLNLSVDTLRQKYDFFQFLKLMIIDIQTLCQS